MKQILPVLFLLVLFGCIKNPTHEVAVTKSDNSLPELTPETRALYNNLKKVAKTHVLFGHQDAVAYGISWKGGDFNSDVEKVAGDYPAVFGWDIGHIDSTRNLDSVPFDHMRNWIIKAYEKGGINTIGWHEINLRTLGSSWDNTRVVDQMLPGGELNSAFIAQLDKVADFINSLKTSEGTKVPVIFRPFHEHNGGWFWWGNTSCNDEEYKQLWKFTYYYLREVKVVNNILFCYSTDAFTGRDEYLARYPGDDYVDIFGFDDYKSVRNADTRQVFIDRLEVVNQLAKERDKVAILAETGSETIPDPNWYTSVLLDGYKAAPNTGYIAYMLVWRNAWPHHHYAPYPGHPAAEDFRKFKNDSITLFLSDLPNMYK